MMWFKLINAAVDFVYPPSCCLCLKPIQRLVLSDELKFRPELCTTCQNNIPGAIINGCIKCGAPSGPYVDTSHGCIYCKDEHYSFKETYAYGVYRGEIKRICLFMKRPTKKFLTIKIGDLLAHSAKSKIQEWQPEIVISVPSRVITPWSSYNPAPESLATVISQKFKLSHHRNVIQKIKATPKQISLSPTERKQNLKQAYRVNKIKSIKNKKILIVDDTLTTGSTVHEIAKVLMSGGATAVYVVVFSRGIGLNFDS